MKLSVGYDLSGEEIRLILCWIATRKPEVMDSYPNKISEVRALIKEDLRRYGIYNRAGWSDALEQHEIDKIGTWAEIYCRRFAL